MKTYKKPRKTRSDKKNRHNIHTTIDGDSWDMLQSLGIAVSEALDAVIPFAISDKDKRSLNEMFELRRLQAEINDLRLQGRRKETDARRKQLEAQSFFNMAEMKEMELAELVEQRGSLLDRHGKVFARSRFMAAVDDLVSWLPRVFSDRGDVPMADLLDLCRERILAQGVGKTLHQDVLQEALDRIRIEQGV